MAKSELGTKRIDPETGRKFYDLNKDPIVSPYTGKTYPRSYFESGTDKIVEDEVEAEEKEVDVEEDGSGTFMPIQNGTPRAPTICRRSRTRKTSISATTTMPSLLTRKKRMTTSQISSASARMTTKSEIAAPGPRPESRFRKPAK